MDKQDHPSLVNVNASNGWEWKIHSEIKWKEWKNNVHRVWFPTQICQFWDTGAESQRVSVSSPSCGVGQGQVSAVVFGWPGQSGAVTLIGGGARGGRTSGQDRYTFLAIATG